MAEVQQQSNVQVQCADGSFINILLDANMAAQLKNGQIFDSFFLHILKQGLACAK